MIIKARLYEMAAEEILKIIPSFQYIRIKSKDPHPTFRAYVVGHEGESKGKLIGEDGKNLGHMVKKWYRSAVQKIHDKIQLGMNFFHGHNYDNSIAGRTSIGEVVGKTTQMINDKLSVIAVAYIRPEFRSLPLDVASIEANIRLAKEGDELVADVDDISGIALGNSATEIPGFPGATLLAQVQEFAEQNQHFLKGKGEEMGEITIDQIRELIKSEGITPTDLFSLGAITDVQDVKDLIEREKREARSGEYHHRKRHEKTFDEQKAEWESKEKEYQEAINQLKPLAIKNQRDTLFAQMVKNRNLDEKETAFIKRNLDGFNPEDPEKIEKELDKFVDNQLDAFTELAKDVFGVDTKKGDDGKPGVKPADKSGEGNPFIPSVPT